jgi:capsid protein
VTDSFFNPLDPYVAEVSPQCNVHGWTAPSTGAIGWGRSYEATRPSDFKRERPDLGGSGDKHLDHWTLWELRETSLALDRSNGLSYSAIDRGVENLLGQDGYELQAGTDSDLLNKEIERDWLNHLETVMDPAGQLHGWEYLEIFLRSALTQGDQAIQWDDDAADGEGQFQQIEASRILTPPGYRTFDGQEVIHGISKDRKGAPQWYWIANEIPLTQSISPQDGAIYPASEIDMFFSPRRISNSRGLPIMTPVIREYDDLDDLLMYERIGSKLASSMGYFIETDEPDETADWMRAASDPSGQYQRNDRRVEQVGPGSVHYTKPGQTAKLLQGTRPSQDVQSFIRTIIKFIGLPLGLPYELLMLDCEKATLGTLRVTLQFAQRCFMRRQAKFGWFLSRIYRHWIANQVRRGKYPDRPDIARHAWDYPGWPSPQPVQDANADAIAIKQGSQSATGMARTAGRRIDQVRIERQRDFQAEPHLLANQIDNPNPPASTPNGNPVSEKSTSDTQSAKTPPAKKGGKS